MVETERELTGAIGKGWRDMMPKRMEQAEEALMVEVVSVWVSQVRDKLNSEAARLRVKTFFREQMKLGAIPVMNVIAAEKAGSREASLAIREHVTELLEHDGPIPTTVRAYIQQALHHGPVTASRGGDAVDNCMRDVGIAVLVHLTVLTFGLKPSRNPTSKRPCASSIVSAALGRYRVNVLENRVARIHRDFDKIAERLTAALPEISAA